jgi:hypothetical protein
MRHPLRGAFLIFMIGAAMLRLNWFFELLMILNYTCSIFALANDEERLVIKYGEEYMRYKERIGTFWPWSVLDCGVSKKRAKSIIESNASDYRNDLLPKVRHTT